MKKIILTVLLLAFLTTFGLYASERTAIDLTTAEKGLVEQNNAFAVKLFAKTRGDVSTVQSPLSVTYLMTMLANGATSQTLNEMTTTLGFGSDLASANSLCHKLMSTIGSLDADTKVQTGNAIFLNQGFTVKPAYTEKVSTLFDATLETRNFADGLTRDAINRWAADHTEQMIDEVLTEMDFDPTVLSYMLNAVYFKGKWTNKFDKSFTVNEPFNGGTEVPMMMRMVDTGYDETADYQAVNLPYSNETFQMTVLLPREGKTLADVLGSIKADQWGSYVSGMGKQTVTVKLPRFSTSHASYMNEALKSLGIVKAFTPQAEFTEMTDQQLFISVLKHVAQIKVDEEGSEAAAVTIGGVGGSNMNTKEFYATRPFLYIISEWSTGTILFMGQYMGEGTTTAVASPHQTASTLSPSTQLYDLQGRRMGKPTHPGVYIRNGKLIVAQ